MNATTMPVVHDFAEIARRLKEITAEDADSAPQPKARLVDVPDVDQEELYSDGGMSW